MLTEYDPDTVGVKEYTASAPGVPQGPPRLFHEPLPVKLNDSELPQVGMFVMSSQGLDEGAPETNCP